MVVLVVVLRLPQLLAITTLDGADWTTCNQLGKTIVQLSMAIKFMSLEEIKQGKSFEMNETLIISLFNFLDTRKFGATTEIQRASN